MKTTRVYVSGPMTGITNLNLPEFLNVKKFYETFCNSEENKFEVIIPHELKHTSTDWKECMERDIEVLGTCDEVFMLDGWRKSPGARIEYHIAKKFLGLRIVGAV